MGKRRFCTFPQFYCGKVRITVDNSVDILWVLHKREEIPSLLWIFSGY